MAARKHERGVTLIELMIVLAIIGVVAGVAVAYQSLSPSSAEVSARAREMYSLFQDARNDAIGNGRQVVVEFIDENLIRSARDVNNSGVIDDGDLIRQEVSFPRLMVLTSGEFERVIFTTRGYLLDGSGQPAVIDMHLCEGTDGACNGIYQGHLTVSVLGLPHLE